MKRVMIFSLTRQYTLVTIRQDRLSQGFYFYEICLIGFTHRFGFSLGMGGCHADTFYFFAKEYFRPAIIPIAYYLSRFSLCAIWGKFAHRLYV